MGEMSSLQRENFDTLPADGNCQWRVRISHLSENRLEQRIFPLSPYFRNFAAHCHPGFRNPLDLFSSNRCRTAVSNRLALFFGKNRSPQCAVGAIHRRRNFSLDRLFVSGSTKPNRIGKRRCHSIGLHWIRFWVECSISHYLLGGLAGNLGRSGDIVCARKIAPKRDSVWPLAGCRMFSRLVLARLFSIFSLSTVLSIASVTSHPPVDTMQRESGGLERTVSHT